MGTVILPYEGEKRAKALRKVSKQFNLKPVFRKNKNLAGYFSKSYKKNTNIEAGGIYKLRCRCNEIYIGETGNRLDERLKQHKYSIKTMDPNSGTANHSTECSQGIKWEESKIINRESNWGKRLIKESLYIQLNKPKINMKPGYKLAGNWNN